MQRAKATDPWAPPFAAGRAPRVATAVALGTALLLAACSAGASPTPSPTLPPIGLPTPAPTPGEPAGIDGRTFLSTLVVQGGQARPLVPGTRIRLSFEDGRLGASAGCNHFGGTYRLDGDRLIVTGGAMTEMACEEPRMAQDDWLFAFLGATPTVTLAGDELTLRAGDTMIQLLDREVAEPDMELVGQTWTVDAIVTGDVVSSVPVGVLAWLLFTADGRFEMDTGCNAGGGRVVVDDATLRFIDVATTKRFCEGAAGQMEAAVLAVLSDGPVSYSIDADTLHLAVPGHGLILKGVRDV